MIRTRDPLLPKKQSIAYRVERIEQGISNGLGTLDKHGVNLETRLGQASLTV